MNVIVELLSLPSTYMFLSVSILPIVLFFKGKKQIISKEGYYTLLIGTLILSLATFLGMLYEYQVDLDIVNFSLMNLGGEGTRLIFIYLPGILLVVYGLSKSLPSIKDLSDEVQRRTKAEEEMVLLLEDMQKLASKADDANQAKSNFLASMSHELRTPLNAIIGFAEMLSLPNANYSREKQIEYNDIIAKSGKHLLSLINDILDLSKIEEGKLELTIEKCNIDHVLSDALENVQLVADNKNIEFNIKSEPFTLSTDRRLLKQILINLLSNAVKFSFKDSQITISSKSIANGLSISIQDEGIGMTAEEAEKVTEPFFQVEETYNRTAEGTGLGLALVKRFAEFIGGKLTISSVKGEGTIATVEVIDLSEEIDSKAAAHKSFSIKV